MAKTLGGAKSTLWYIHLTKESTGKINNTKWSERQQKTTAEDNGCFSFSLGQEKSLKNIQPSQKKLLMR